MQPSSLQKNTPPAKPINGHGKTRPDDNLANQTNSNKVDGETCPVTQPLQS